MKKSELRGGKAILSFFSTFYQVRKNVSLSVNPDEIIDEGKDDRVFKLAARENMAHLKRLTDHCLVVFGKNSI